MSKMDPKKLARYCALSDKICSDSEIGISDPEIVKFMERIASGGYSLEADFFVFLKNHGFFQAPHRTDMNGVDIALVGVPMDQSAPGRGGTRLGPQAARKWSHIHGPVHEIWRTMPFDLCSIIDYGDVAFSGTGGEARCADIYNVYKEFHRRGIATLSCGGEHTMTRPITIAMGEDEPMGLVHIDAHADTGGIPAGMDGYNDCSIFREAVIAGAIDPERTIQIGIRGRATYIWDFSHESGMCVVSADEVRKNGIHPVIEKMKKIIGEGPVYLSVDTDGIDCVHMPGTTLPEPFGLLPVQVRDIIRGMRGMDLRGADITELNPMCDPTEQSANIVSALMFEMLCVLSESKMRRNGEAHMTQWM